MSKIIELIGEDLGQRTDETDVEYEERLRSFIKELRGSRLKSEKPKKQKAKLSADAVAIFAKDSNMTIEEAREFLKGQGIL